jgi:hypothetical protein
MKKIAIILLFLAFVSLLIIKGIQDRVPSPISHIDDVESVSNRPAIPHARYASNGAFVLGTPATSPPSQVGFDSVDNDLEAKATRLYQDLFALSSNLRSAVLTQSDSDAVYKAARELANSGSLGVRALFSILQSTNNVRLPKNPGGAALPTFRAVLIDSLGQLQGEESLVAHRGLLSTATDPLEIAMLVKNIDRLAPGKFNDDLVMAASRQLETSASANSPGDVSSLFKVIEKQVSSETVAKLTSKMDQWQYYSALALALAPEGVGYSTLVSKALASSGSVGEKAFAWQMVGQSSVRSPVATQVFLDIASRGGIPDNAWPKIAEGIAGEQFSYSAPVTDPAPYAQKPGLKSYHIEDGNQNYYSLPVGALSPDEIQSRLQLVNQLIAAGGSPAQLQSLNSARNALLGMVVSPH